MDVARRLAWFDPIDSAGSIAGAGRLCERHARAMVLPQGWFLDDRRVEFPQLFSAPGAKPAAAAMPAPESAPEPTVEGADKPAPKPRKPRKKKVAPEPELSGDQGSLLPDARPTVEAPIVESTVDVPAVEEASTVAATTTEPAAAEPPMASGALGDLGDLADGDNESWSPRFDQRDDLNGLLSAETPLLSRAFGKKRRVG